MVPLASWLRPWLTASSSSDSESSTRLHHSSYLVTLLISSSILSGPTFPIVVFSRNLTKRFSHRGFPSRAQIDRGRVKAPVVGSFYTSRRTSLKAGQPSRTCVLVSVGGCTLSYLSSLLYTNKLYSKILHPVTDEVTMLQTSNTRSYTLSRSSNTRSYIILRASNTQSYIILRASNTQGYIILRTSNTRSYTCHGRVTYEVTNFHRRITHDHTRVTQQVHRYY
jgi:hypothetical protein